jgi:hypothetical protein
MNCASPSIGLALDWVDPKMSFYYNITGHILIPTMTAASRAAPVAPRAASAITTTIPAVSAGTAVFPGPSKVHLEFPVSKGFPVEHVDGLFRIRLVAHFDESEAFGLPCVSILDQGDRGHGSCLSEQLLQLSFGCGK